MIQTISEAVEPPAGSWDDEGEDLLRYQISTCILRNKIADLLDCIELVEFDGGYFGASLSDLETIRGRMRVIDEVVLEDVARDAQKAEGSRMG